MTRNVLYWTALAAGALAGCSGGGGGAPAGQTTLSVSLMDAPVDGVTAVYVHLTALWLKPQGNGPAVQLPLVGGARTVDLLQLTDQTATILVDDLAIDPGSYEWLAMDVSAEHDGIYDSYVETAAGGQVELRVPSGRVRLVSGFDVEANQANEFLFDWSVRQGLVAPVGQAGYLLKPAFRMLDVTEYGVLKGTVDFNKLGDAANGCLADDPQVAVGNVVYVFSGHGATPDDYDGSGDPVAEARVTETAGVYSYRVLLTPGQYTVAFTCRGAHDVDLESDDADPLVFFTPAVDVTMAGDTQTVDF
jgi:hypothetical protein